MSTSPVLQLLSKYVGTDSMVVTPRFLIKYVGDMEGASFLNQLLYLSFQNNFDWVARTYEEWYDDILVSKYIISKYAYQFRQAGFLEIGYKSVKSAKVVHYKINKKKFENSFVKFLMSENSSVKNLTFKRKNFDVQPSKISLSSINKELTKRTKSVPKKTTPLKNTISEGVNNLCIDLVKDINSILPKEHKIGLVPVKYKKRLAKVAAKLDIKEYVYWYYTEKMVPRDKHFEFPLFLYNGMVEEFLNKSEKSVYKSEGKKRIIDVWDNQSDDKDRLKKVLGISE